MSRREAFYEILSRQSGDMDDDIADILKLLREPTQAMLDAAYEYARRRMREVYGIEEGSALDFMDRREFDVHFAPLWRAALDAALT